MKPKGLLEAAFFGRREQEVESAFEKPDGILCTGCNVELDFNPRRKSTLCARCWHNDNMRRLRARWKEKMNEQAS